jgi:aerobic carbon-monoxide dehydrogenase medium subunit
LKPAPFDYRRPESLEEALELLAEHGDDCKPLAGGQSLVPLLNLRLAKPALLVDLERVPELRGIERSGRGWRIGAMARQSEVERHPGLPAVVREAVRHVGHFQVRSRGTVGGSLAHMDPAAEWPALALLLDARLTVASRRGRRVLAAAELGLGPLTTCLAPDELLLQVELDEPAGGYGFAEVERRPGDFALVGAACQGQALVVFAAGGLPQRLPGCEEHLRSGGRGGAELAALAASEIEAAGDLHAPAAYRRQVGARLVSRVAERACA